MKAAAKISQGSENQHPQNDVTRAKASDQTKVETLIQESWSKISPTWPLKNLIAVNPLAGFEDLSFEDALHQGQAYFQTEDVPEKMQAVNRQTIKWLQAFFDDGQSTLQMPLRDQGLYNSVMSLLAYDKMAAPQNKKTKIFIDNLPSDTTKVIEECLLFLGVYGDQQSQFATLMLTTMPGWSAYIKYRTEWADAADEAHPHSATQADFLALRLVLTCLIWPEAKALLDWHETAMNEADLGAELNDIYKTEHVYRNDLLNLITSDTTAEAATPDAQLVFCIDVRSEPFRRALEAQGQYETYGFAGFFGVPVSIENAITGENHASCPVLLKPAYAITEKPTGDLIACQASHNKRTGIKSLYQSLKYNFTTPFTLVEALGPFSGAFMGLRSFFPNATKPQQAFDTQPDISAIPAEDQVNFAFGALRMMGLTDNFAPLVVFCGHGSETQNNAYATALDCGACGGHEGSPNAKILAAILNSPENREAIAQKGIIIPDETYFMAGQHNTTTDKITLYKTADSQPHAEQIQSLEDDLTQAQEMNSMWRAAEMGENIRSKAADHTRTRAQDWAQVRPEWGLAKNAAFIVAPRSITKNINLEGRSFLHSYDYTADEDGSALTVILTAPMVVAQWINTQYFFSTFDNVAYGSGSKISQNITGKIGVIQGNASDLMHGLSMQSVNSSDDESYHKPLRLMTIVYAPPYMIDRIIAEQDILQKLFGNGWVTLACIDPETQKKLVLGRDLKWHEPS